MTGAGNSEKLIRLMRERGIRDEALLAAMAAVPRERFVPPGYAANAYDDEALPIECGQTISQPYVVAVMTRALHIDSTSRVLEIGTGSGYQAAILAHLAAEVFSIEVHKPLHRIAAERLEQLGLHNVRLKCGDGAQGWPECAPFDGIMVTAAGAARPPLLLEQLGPGGRLVLPLGGPLRAQQLAVIMRTGRGLVREDLFPVRFVPLLGRGGQ
jgi:protein-L-isoaspartate(D-aspartate) O-methyltransferase